MKKRLREKLSWCLFEARPALYTPGEAWAFGQWWSYPIGNGRWRTAPPRRQWVLVHSAEVAMNGITWSTRTGKITRRRLIEMFGAIPRLPREAFA